MELQQTQGKSFWQRPEGKLGAVVLAAMIVLGFALLYVGLPYILKVLSDLTLTLMYGVPLAIFAIIVTDKKNWIMIKAAYQIVMKKITGVIVELDPIAIIEGYLETLRASLDKMDEQLDLLKGQETQLNTKILTNRAEITKSLERASKAKQSLENMDKNSQQYLDYKSVAVLDSNKAARYKSSNEKLEEVLSKIVNLRKILEKMYASARFVLSDMTDEVKIKKEESAAISKGYSAFKSAMKVFEGNPDEKALFDQSMEFMANDLGNKVGEIERFMENSGTILTSMDIDNEAFAEKGLKLIDEWMNKGDDIFITSPKNETPKLTQTTVATSNSSFLGNGPVSKSKYIS